LQHFRRRGSGGRAKVLAADTVRTGSLPNRRNGPRLAAHARLTQEARRLAGVPAEAFAEFPPAWIERVREGKYWFAGA